MTRVVVDSVLNPRRWVAYEGSAGYSIGRDTSCAVQIDSHFVSRFHAKVDRCEHGWEIVLPDGVNPVEVDGKELLAGGRMLLKPVSEVRIVDHVLTIESSAATKESDHEEEIVELQRLLHINVLRKLDLRLGGGVFEATQQRIEQIDGVIDGLLRGDFQAQCSQPPLVGPLLQQAVRSRLTSMLAAAAADELPRAPYAAHLTIPALEQGIMPALREMLAQKGSNGHDGAADIESRVDDLMAARGRSFASQLLENHKRYLVSSDLKRTLFDTIFGYGPLQELIDSPDVSEIMVVHPSLIYVERAGRVVRTRKRFTSPEAATAVLERIVAPMGRRIDRSQPLVDARLSDGSRVNAIIEPLAIHGACITIRKFPARSVTVEDLLRWGSINPLAAEFLAAAVRYRANLVIAGGTGSGKTTLLNVLSGMIPRHERLVTIEDAAELRLQQEHVVALETRPASAEGSGEVAIRDLVKNALRMRPDRIIVGECRGGEALDMLQAMNTGHAGSMTTLHANSAEDVISRLETMVLTAADLPLSAVRQQLARSLDLVVYIRRLPRGRRMVTQVSEVTGINPVSGEVELRDLMRADGPEAGAALALTGYLPTFLNEMVEQGHLDLQRWLRGSDAQ